MTDTNDPDQLLKQKQADRAQKDSDLKKTTQDATKLTGDIKALDDEIKVLTTESQENKKADEEYQKAYPAFHVDWMDLRQYRRYKEDELRDALGAAADTVKTTVDAAFDRITQLEDAVTNATTKRATCQQDLDDATAKDKAAEAYVGRLTAMTATIKDRLAKLDKIRTEVNALEKGGQPAVALWLLSLAATKADEHSDFDQLLAERPELLEPATLREAINGARAAHGAAQADKATKTTALNEADRTWAKATKDLDEARKTLDTDIRTALGQIKPAPAPVPAPAPAPAPADHH